MREQEDPIFFSRGILTTLLGTLKTGHILNQHSTPPGLAASNTIATTVRRPIRSDSHLLVV